MEGLPQDTLVGEIVERLERRAMTVFESNKAWGRKGKAWALEEEHDWKAAALIRSLSEANAALEVELTTARVKAEGCNLNLVSLKRAETAEAALSAATLEIERLKGALTDILEWYDRDGSAGTIGDVMEPARAELAASKAEAAEQRGNDLEGRRR